MDAVQDAVKALAASLLAVLLVSVAAPTIGSVEHQQAGGEILVFYDRTRPAYYLFDYGLRLLVVSKGEGESCWEEVEGRVVMACKPLKGATVKVSYEELKEYREAVVGEDGVVEVSYRILTFPKASFRVQVYSPEGYSEARLAVETGIWAVPAIASFSITMGLMILVVRRSMW